MKDADIPLEFILEIQQKLKIKFTENKKLIL